MFKKKGGMSDLVFKIAIAIIILYAIKLAFNIDPPLEDVISSIPWIAVAFGCGAIYHKIHVTSKDLADVKSDLKEVRDTVNQIKGKLSI